jgi:hypothetical protein
MNEPGINARSRDPAVEPVKQIINFFNNSMKNQKKSNLIIIHKISNHMKTKYDLKRLWLTRGVFALLFTMFMLFSGLVSAQTATMTFTVYGPGSVTLTSSNPGVVTFRNIAGGGAASTLSVSQGQSTIEIVGATSGTETISVSALVAPFYRWMNPLNLSLNGAVDLTPNSFIFQSSPDLALTASFYQDLTVHLLGAGASVDVFVGSVVPNITTNVSVSGGTVSIPGHVTVVNLTGIPAAGFGFYQWQNASPDNVIVSGMDMSTAFGSAKNITLDTRELADFTFNLASRDYDGTNVVYAPADLIETPIPGTVTYTAIIDGQFTYSDANVGVGKTVTGTITLTGSDAVGGASYMYSTNGPKGSLTKTFATTGTIVPKPMTITANSFPKVYGDIITPLGTEFTTADLVGVETITVTLTSAGYVCNASVASSPYTITPSAAVAGAGTLIGNYSITYTAGALTVTPMPLTITANSFPKVYGDIITPAGTEFTTSGTACGEPTGSVTLASPGYVCNASVASSPYTITPSAATSSGTFNVGNYSITYTTGLLTVTPMPLTITANSFPKVYGDIITPAGTEFTTSGTACGEPTGSVTLVSPGYVCNASVASSPYTITPSAATSSGTFNVGNYSITYTTGLLTVTPMPLTITANSFPKVYGDIITPAGTEFTTSGTACGEPTGSVTLVSPGYVCNASVASSPYTITPSAATSSGTFNVGNYSITYTTGLLTVTPMPLTITANSFPKVYGDIITPAGTEFTTSGTACGEPTGSVTLVSPGYACNASVASSPYTITPSAATSSGTFNVGNYSITYTTGLLTVTPMPLTITANSFPKVYGDIITPAGTEFTTSGTACGEPTGSVTLVSPGYVCNASVASSPYTITPSAATSSGTFNVGNYSITYTTGLLTVTPMPLTITANSFPKVYGDIITPAGTEFTTSGTACGEPTGSVTLVSPGYVCNASVASSPYTITPSAATSSGTFNVGNYSITYTTGLLTVTPKALTITANNRTKVYGEVVTPLGTEFTPVGLACTDAIDNVVLTSNGFAAGATYTVPGPVYPIVPSNATGAVFAAGNYSITYTNGTVTLSQRPIGVVSATAQNKVYDGNDVAVVTGAALEPQSSGRGWMGDNIFLQNHISGTFEPDGTVAVGKPVTTAITLGGTAIGNYAFDPTTSLQANITQRPITITVTPNQSKVYGTADPVFAYTSVAGPNSGLAQTDGFVGALSRSGGNDVGTYSITMGTLDINGPNPGLTLTNYNLTFVGADFTITPKQLTITGAVAQNKVYNGNTVAVVGGAILNGAAYTDELQLVNGTVGAFDTKHVGIGKVVTTTMTVTATTGNINNYIQPVSPVLSANITARDLNATVTADNKEYDGTTVAVLNPAFTNLLGSDDVSFTNGSTGNFASANAGTWSVTTTLGITGADAGNYNFIAPANPSATISKRAITVNVPQGQAKNYGQPDPVLQYSLAAGSTLAATHTWTGTLSREAGENVGTYNYITSPITISDAGNNNVTANYDITYAAVAVPAAGGNPGVFTINPTSTPVVIKADDKSKFRCADDPTFTFTTTGLYGSDYVTATLSRTPAGNDPGLYTIGIVTYTLHTGNPSNYSNVSTATGTLTIIDGPADLVVTIVGYGSVVVRKEDNSVAGNIVGPIVGSTVTGFSTNELITLQAIPNAGYVFTGWTQAYTGMVNPVSLTMDCGKFMTATFKKEVTLADITVTAGNKTYDGNNLVTTYTVLYTGPLYPGQSAPTVGVSSPTFDNANAGVGKTVTFTNFNLTNLTAFYQLAPGVGTSTKTTTANITRRPLPVAGATVPPRVYDGTTTAYIVGAVLNTGGGNLVAGDVVTLTNHTTGTFTGNTWETGANIGTAKAVTHTMTLIGTPAPNYQLVVDALTGVVTPRSLVFTAVTIADKVFDGTTDGKIATIGATSTWQNIIAGDATKLSVGTQTAVATFDTKWPGTGKVVTIADQSPGIVLAAANTTIGASFNPANYNVHYPIVTTGRIVKPVYAMFTPTYPVVRPATLPMENVAIETPIIVEFSEVVKDVHGQDLPNSDLGDFFVVEYAAPGSTTFTTVPNWSANRDGNKVTFNLGGNLAWNTQYKIRFREIYQAGSTTPGTAPVIWTLDGAARNPETPGALVESKEIHFRTLSYENWVKPDVTPYGSGIALCNQTIKLTFKNPVKYRNTNEITDNPKHKFSLQYLSTTTGWTNIDPTLWSVSIDVAGNPKVFTFTYSQQFAYNTQYRIKNNIGVDGNYGFIDKVTGQIWLGAEVDYTHSQGTNGWNWTSTPMYPLSLSVNLSAAFGAVDPYNAINMSGALTGTVSSTTATIINIGVASSTAVVLTADAGEGYKFTHWTRIANGTPVNLGTASFPATFTLNHVTDAPACGGTIAYRANFELNNYKVSRLMVGAGSNTLTVTGQTANPSNHNHGTTAVWTATPAPGKQHTDWTFTGFPTVGTYSRVVTYGNINGATPTPGTVSIVFNGSTLVDAGNYTITATYSEFVPQLKASAGFAGTGDQPMSMIGLIQFTTNFVSSLSNPGIESPNFQNLQYQQVNVKYDTIVTLLAHSAPCIYTFVKWQYYDVATSMWVDYVTTGNALGANPITFKMDRNVRFKAVYKNTDNVLVSATAMNTDWGSVAVYNNPLRREGDLIQFNGAPVGGASQNFVPGTTLYLTVFPEPEYQSYRWELAGTNTTTTTVVHTGDLEDRSYYTYVVDCVPANLKAIIGLKEYKVTVRSLNKNEGTINASTPAHPAFVAAESKTVTGFKFTTAANPGTLNSGIGDFQRNQTVVFAATATGTFAFDYWVDNNNQSVIVSQQNPYTETVLGDRDLRAVFKSTLPPAPTYALSVIANPAQGAVTRNSVVVTNPVTGIYNTVAVQSSSWTFTALPKAGYSFTNWTIAGASVVTTTATTTLIMPPGTVTLTANFVPTQYAVYVNVRTHLRADPISNFTVVNYGGTVTPVSGTYTAGSTINLVATAASGFRFVNWMSGTVNPENLGTRILRGTHLSDSPAYTYTVPAVAGSDDMNIYAIFIEISDFPTPYPVLDLYTEAVPAGVGVQTGAAKYAYGVQALVTAQATTPGWQFSSWSSNVIPADNYVNMIGHATATATYTRIPYMLYVQETTALGTVSGTSSFFYNSLPIPVAAAPKPSTNPLYTNVFQGWYTDFARTIPLLDAGGNVVTNPEFNFIPYVLPAPQTSVTIYAKFGQVTNTFSVTAQTALNTPANLNPIVGTATVTPAAATYNYGQALVVSTTPNPNNGYAFQYWTDPTGLLYIEQQSFNHVVTENMQFIAVYSLIPYTVTASAQMGGTVTPVTATYTIGQTATVVAAADMGYQFDGWEVVSGTVTFTATNTTASFVMPGSNVVLLAKFSKIPYTVTATAETGGTATPATQTKNYGDAVTVTANALAGYTFNGWVDVVGATVTNTMNPLSFTMPNNNVSLKASFVATPYTVSVIAVPANGGTFSAVNPTYTVGQAVAVTATPAAGFEFTGWAAVGVTPVNLASPTVSFNMPAGNVTLTATFAPLGNTLSGSIKYFNQFESMLPVKSDFTVGLYDGASLVGTSTLTAAGRYSFTGIQPGLNYTVRVMASGINTPLGGVSAADALVVNYMVIQSPVTANFPWVNATGATPPVYTPFGIKVADVNSMGGVTALDALTILYRTVNNITSYPNTPDFQVAAGEVASHTAKTYPQAPGNVFSFAAGTYSGSWTGKAGQTIMNLYFVATGDINASYVPQSAKAKVNLNYSGQISAKVGDVVSIPVSIDQAAQIGAMTLGLSFNNNLLEVLSVEGYAVYTVDNKNGTIRIADMNLDAKNVSANDDIVIITAKVLAPIEANTRYFEIDEAEFANRAAAVIDGITLTTKSITGEALSVLEAGDLISSAYPNPFKDMATINFTLPEAGKVTIVVYNKFGQEVKTLVNENREAGVQYNVELNSYDLTGSGTYFYRILVEGTAKTYTANGTLILVK